MNLSFYIAKRYLFSKKSRNVINIISGISTLVVAVVTAAMIIVLSAFNGIEQLVDELFSSFDSDISVTAAGAKTFSSDSLSFNQLSAIDGVHFYTLSVEENIILEYGNSRTIATMKGVGKSFLEMSHIPELMYVGDATLESQGAYMALMGYFIYADLKIPVSNTIRVYAPQRGKKDKPVQEKAFNEGSITLGGVFSVNVDFDSKYVVVPLEFATGILGYDREVSSVEIKIKEGYSLEEVQQKIKEWAGAGYSVKTRYEKNLLVYQTSRMEKWITFAILLFILLVAAFNILASLTMLVLEKRRDISVMISMGANRKLIRQIFLTEGILINLLGGVIGLLLGLLICFLQQKFGLISMQGGIVDFYPVKFLFSDFVLIITAVLLVGLLSSWIPVRHLTKKYFG